MEWPVKFQGPFNKQIHRDQTREGFGNEKEDDYEPVRKCVDYTLKQAVEINQIFPDQKNQENKDHIKDNDHQYISANISEQSPLFIMNKQFFHPGSGSTNLVI